MNIDLKFWWNTRVLDRRFGGQSSFLLNHDPHKIPVQRRPEQSPLHPGWCWPHQRSHPMPPASLLIERCAGLGHWGWDAIHRLKLAMTAINLHLVVLASFCRFHDAIPLSETTLSLQNTQIYILTHKALRRQLNQLIISWILMRLTRGCINNMKQGLLPSDFSIKSFQIPLCTY